MHLALFGDVLKAFPGTCLDKWLVNPMACLLIMGCLVSDSLAAKKDGLSDLTSLTVECTNTGQISICRRALFRTEVLQRQAGSNGNYACQSRLLGLGAELLIISFDSKQEVFLPPMLKEVMI